MRSSTTIIFPSAVLAPIRYRGCELCDHGARSDGTCANAQFSSEASTHVLELRAPGGACGPEAKALTFPGLED